MIQGPPGIIMQSHYSCLHMPIIVGTGKSVTGAHLAYIFAKSNRKVNANQFVLYCGPSNKSVDVVHGEN